MGDAFSGRLNLEPLWRVLKRHTYDKPNDKGNEKNKELKEKE